MLNLSPVYMSTIETGQAAAPRNEILTKLEEHLKLDKWEREQMYELAAKSKSYTAVPGDLLEYISTNEYARIALRAARDMNATDRDWQEFIYTLLRERGLPLTE